MLANAPADIVMQLDEAFVRRDIEAVLSFYEDGAAVVTEPGRVARGKQELRKFFTQLFALQTEAKQLKTHVLESGDIALFISKSRLTGKNLNGQPFSRESVATTVFRKSVDGQWRIVIDNALGPAVLESETST